MPAEVSALASATLITSSAPEAAAPAAGAVGAAVGAAVAAGPLAAGLAGVAAGACWQPTSARSSPTASQERLPADIRSRLILCSSVDSRSLAQRDGAMVA